MGNRSQRTTPVEIVVRISAGMKGVDVYAFFFDLVLDEARDKSLTVAAVRVQKGTLVGPGKMPNVRVPRDRLSRWCQSACAWSSV